MCLFALCADHRGENRSYPELGQLDIQATIDCLNCPEARTLCGLCTEIRSRIETPNLSENPIEAIYQDTA